MDPGLDLDTCTVSSRLEVNSPAQQAFDVAFADAVLMGDNVGDHSGTVTLIADLDGDTQARQRR